MSRVNDRPESAIRAKSDQNRATFGDRRLVGASVRVAACAAIGPDGATCGVAQIWMIGNAHGKHKGPA
jgi:hypothetical protein